MKKSTFEVIKKYLIGGTYQDYKNYEFNFLKYSSDCPNEELRNDCYFVISNPDGESQEEYLPLPIVDIENLTNQEKYDEIIQLFQCLKREKL